MNEFTFKTFMKFIIAPLPFSRPLILLQLLEVENLESLKVTETRILKKSVLEQVADYNKIWFIS